MIVADTSSLISLTTVDLPNSLLTEYEVHTTETVIEELENTVEYDDSHAKAAETVLNNVDQIIVHADPGEFTSSRVDPGEGTCALLTKEIDAEFLITDDLQALPEIQTVADAQVAISPILLKALVKKDVLTRDDAMAKLNALGEQCTWLGAPIYRRAQALFEQ